MAKKASIPLKLPYAISTVLRHQNKLPDTVFLRRYIGTKLTNADVQTIAGYLRQYIKRCEIPLDFYIQCLEPFTIYKPSADAWRETLKRIISTAYTLTIDPLRVTDIPAVTVWLIQQQTEWIPCVINEIDTNQLENTGLAHINCTALCTRMVDVTFTAPISANKIRHAAYNMGFRFTPRADHTLYQCAEQLVSLHAVMEIREGSTRERTWLGDIGYHQPTIAYNQQIMKQRYIPSRRCPHGCKTPCYRCGIGKDKCALAVIPVTDTSVINQEIEK
jgi:hypothetical protein